MPDIFYRNLPHYHPPNATYFVTFRLAGSIPLSVLKTWQAEQERELQTLAQTFEGTAFQNERYLLSKRMFAKYDDYLEREEGPCWLKEARFADIVAQEIHRLHPEFYHLIAFSLMSNHGHLLIDMQDIPEPVPPKSGQHYTALSHAMRLVKGRTGYTCMKMLGQNGAFWQSESYDHVVRNEAEFQRILWYILNNPVRAGLVKDWRAWQYNYVADGYLP
jgi:putative transposase